MSFVELEKKIESLPYEYQTTIWNMVDYFYEKQQIKNQPTLEDARNAFYDLCNEASAYNDMNLDEINAEIVAARRDAKKL